MSLELKNLHITTAGKKIVSGLSLTIKPGEVHAIMGPNGSGKSTLANAIMGHPKYTITKGMVMVDGKNITSLSADKKAKAGLFLSPQHPPEIPGVTMANFLRVATAAMTGKKNKILEFRKDLAEKMKNLQMDQTFATRYLNTGFSGGEKKRAEILQLAILNPKYAVLDETDSGLDVDALKIVSAGINQYKSKEHGLLIITHYNRILEYIEPDYVHVMYQGKIVQCGSKALAKEIEKKGYAHFALKS